MKRSIYLLILCFSVFCVGNKLYAQSPKAVSPFFNGVFPETTPGASGAWDVEDYAPNIEIQSPVKILELPDENGLFILSKLGELWIMDISDKTHRKVLDFKEVCFSLGESGAVGMALHPMFGQDIGKDYIYISYRYKPSRRQWDVRGYNRLARFTWDSDTNQFDRDSEYIHIQQYDRHTWHNGGALFFDPEGFLYTTMGDEGQKKNRDLNLTTQRIDLGFFSGVLRIDVDNDMTRSHPIRRQPQPPAAPPAGWGDTYSQGYSIPNINPWQSETGEFLEEFIAIGLRAPYSAYYDEVEDNIWIADVGEALFEELNLIKDGHNYQWPYFEAESPSTDYFKPDPYIGIETKPSYYYARDLGSAIIGGAIYRGLKYPSLDEQYLFGDFTSNRVFSVDPYGEEEPIVLINNLKNFDLPLPPKPGITSVSVLKDGNVLITVLGASNDFLDTGRIFILKNREIIPDPPLKLSELNVFKNMETRTAVDEFIYYDVNTPLWSDRAIKNRWVAIPNDGNFNSENEQIKFKERGLWTFPEGTVLMKQFDLPLDLNNLDQVIPLETRFFVVGKNNSSYGLTYKWNEDGSEAFLQQSKSQETFDITEGGVFAYEQTWDYPSRSNCMSCHNQGAGFVLGPNTHQMNKEIIYPGTSLEVNQLTYFNSHNIFDQKLNHPSAYLRSHPLENSEVALETRIRSYLDANCSFCHSPEGQVNTSNMDLRFTTPLSRQNMINGLTTSVASTQEYVVTPGNHETSELWLRDATRSENQMPPIASNLLDQIYVDSLAKWIDQFEVIPPDESRVAYLPNPVSHFLRLEVGKEWLPEYEVTLYDMRGTKILSRTMINNVDFLNVSALAAGVYFIEFVRGDKKILDKVVIL